MFSFSYNRTDIILVVCDTLSKIFIVVIIPKIHRVDFQFLTINPKMIYNEDDVNKPNQQIINNNRHLSEETILLKTNSELEDEITKLNTLVNTLKQTNVLYEQQILDLKKSEQVIYSTLEETEDRLLETSEELSVKEKELSLLQKKEIFKEFNQTHYKNKLKDVQLILSTFSDDVRKTFNNKLYRTKSLSCIETVTLRRLSYSSLHNIYLCSQESPLREIVSDLTQLKNLLFRGTSQENFPIEKDKTESQKQKRPEDQPFSNEKLNCIKPQIKSDDTPRTISRRMKHRRRSIQPNNYERRVTDLEDRMKLHLRTFFKNTRNKVDFNISKKLSQPESIEEDPLLSVVKMKKDQSQTQQQYRILQEKYDALREEHNRILTSEDRMITTKKAMATLEDQLEMKRKEYLIISKKLEAALNGNCDELESFQSDPQEENGKEISIVTKAQSEERYKGQQKECFTQQKLKKAEDKNTELQSLLTEKSERYDLLTKEHVAAKNSLKQFEITQEKYLENLKTLRDEYNNKLVTVDDLTDQNKELKRQFKNTQEECDQLIKEKNNEFKNLSEKYGLLTQELVATKNSLKQSEITQQKYLEDLKTLRDEYNNKLVTVEDLTNQTKELKRQFKNTQEELTKEKNYEFKNLSEKYGLLMQEHVATKNSLKQFEITQQKYLEDLKTLRDEYNNKIVTVEELTVENKELKRQFKNTQNERDQLSYKIKNIQEQNYRFRNVSETYDLLREEHVVTKNSLKELELTQQKHLQDLKTLQDRYNNKMGTVEKLTLENKELKRQFGNEQDESNQLRRGIKNMQEKYETLKGEYDEKILIVTNKFTNLEKQYKYQQNQCFTLQENLRNTQENNGKLQEKYSLLKEEHDKNVQKQELLMGTIVKFKTLKQQFEKKQQECIEIYEEKKKLQDSVCSLKKELLQQEVQLKIHQENLVKKQRECSKIIDEYKTLERKYYNLNEKYNNLILTNKEMEKTINSNNTLLKERDLKTFKLTDSKITQLELEKTSLETKIRSYETTLNEKAQLMSILEDQIMRLNATNEDLSKHKVAEEIRSYKTKYVATSEQNRFLTAKIKELEKFKERSADVETIRGELHEVESRLNTTSKELRRIKSRCICDGPNSSPASGSWKTKRRSIQDNQRDMSCSNCNELNEQIKKLEMKIFNVESQQLLPREQDKGELYYQSLVETQQEQLQKLQTNYDKLIFERNKLLQKQCAWGFLENNVSNSLETKKELERLQEELKKISIKYEQAKTIAHRRGKKITELENQLHKN